MDAEETSIIEERDRNAISGEKYQGGVTMNKESDDISTGVNFCFYFLPVIYHLYILILFCVYGQRVGEGEGGCRKP